MLFIAANPCPINRQMEKCTYFCCTCSTLKTFALRTIEYHFYELDFNGHSSHPARTFQFRDDAQAEKHAKRIIEDHDIQIWCGSRLVSTIRAEQWVRRTPPLVP